MLIIRWNIDLLQLKTKVSLDFWSGLRLTDHNEMRNPVGNIIKGCKQAALKSQPPNLWAD